MCVAARSRRHCRAGDFARRMGFAALQRLRDDASIAARRRRFRAQSTKYRPLAWRSSPTDAGQGPGGLYRISPPQSGNAPLRLRLAAHPPSGLRCPHRTARAEARLCSATAALPRSGKDRSGERLAPAGAVSEANRAAGPALRPEIGRSYVFYRRTGDNKRSDGRLPHEKQLSPPQAALGSVAPYRGGFQSSCPKAPLEGELSANADGGVPCHINFVHTLASHRKHFDNAPKISILRPSPAPELLIPHSSFSRSSFQSFPIRSKTEVLP